MLNNLNKNQLEAVVTNDKYVRIVAGAGSGKTRVLTTRIAYLVNELKVFSGKILAITFTNKAANEMKSRVEKQLGDDGAAVHISTIHSLCVRILREDITSMNYPRNFTVVDSEDQKTIIREAYKELNIDRQKYSFGYLLNYIGGNKGAEVSVERALELAGNNHIEKTKAQVYKFYQNRLEQLYALDFDDLLLFVAKMFKLHIEIRHKWQRRYSHIHVDEFQDVDHIQYQIIKYLAGENNELYVVGDPDQTIYTWRGADVNIIMNFIKDFPTVKTIILNQNYRSIYPILKGANSIIVNNKNRVDKELFTESESDEKIIHFSAAGEEYEANWIANKIEDLKSEGVNYRDIAILYRSNYLSRSVEKGLLDYKIPYVIFGGTRFYDRAEVKDALSYLRMVTTADDLAFTRVINTPRRKIGDKSLDLIRNTSKSMDITMYQVIRDQDILGGQAGAQARKFVELIEDCRNLEDVGISDILDKLLKGSGYLKMLNDNQEIDRMENIKELMNDINTFSAAYPEGTLDEYLQLISLYGDREQYDSGSFVQLMTIHAAKGLEFDYVFVAGMSEGVFPSERTLSEGLDGLEEERRLAYVAYTRARKGLFLTESSGYSHVLNKVRTTSRFIKEIDDEYIKHIGASFENKSVDTFPIPGSINGSGIKPTRSELNMLTLSTGQQITHITYGDGIVLTVKNGVVEIAFPHPIGVKKIIEGHPSIKLKEV